MNEPDFVEQREWIREVIEDRGHGIIYYPNYHCELNIYAVILKLYNILSRYSQSTVFFKPFHLN